MPYVSVWVDDAELDEFDSEDLVAELEKRGYSCVKGPASMEGLERIQHLMDCGLSQYAQEEALRMVSEQIGRPGAWTRKELP